MGFYRGTRVHPRIPIPSFRFIFGSLQSPALLRETSHEKHRSTFANPELPPNLPFKWWVVQGGRLQLITGWQALCYESCLKPLTQNNQIHNYHGFKWMSQISQRFTNLFQLSQTQIIRFTIQKKSINCLFKAPHLFVGSLKPHTELQSVCGFFLKHPWKLTCNTMTWRFGTWLSLANI